MHQLQDGADAADGAVDGGGADELRGQVRVEGQLDLHLHVHPQTDNAADLRQAHSHRLVRNVSGSWCSICAALSQACSALC